MTADAFTEDERVFAQRCGAALMLSKARTKALMEEVSEAQPQRAVWSKRLPG